MSIFKKAISIKLLSLLIIAITAGSAHAQLTQTVVSLTGNVTNAVTKEPVTVLMMVYDAKGKRVNAARSNAANDGLYFIAGLKPGETYYIEINQKGYFKEKFEIKVPNTHKYKEISKDFVILPLEKGIHIPISIPPFELKKTKLRFGANEILEGYKNTLANNPKVNFQIVCYPDENNGEDANMKLTTERAKSLMNYFAENGIEISRMTISGSATTDPLNPPPKRKMAKGKRYIGTSYIVVTDF